MAPTTKRKNKTQVSKVQQPSEEPPNCENHESLRSSRFWFNDGDIILQVEGGSLYRMHQSLLSMNSVFFRDMFDTVSASRGEKVDKEEMDGCAIVKMQDSAQDWDTVLRTIYTPLKIHPNQEILEVDELLGMLRLGRKYQFDDLHESALRRLHKELPADLEEFDEAFQPRLQQIYAGDRDDSCTCPRMACNPIPLAKLINFAVTWGIDDVLPVAYYMGMVDFTITHIRDEVKIDDEAVSLAPEATKALIRGQEEILATIFAHIYPWIARTDDFSHPVPVSQCKRPEDCAKAREAVSDEFLRQIQDAGRDYMVHALSKTPLMLAHDDPHVGFCMLCMQQLIEHYEEGRDCIFGSLVDLFDL